MWAALLLVLLATQAAADTQTKQCASASGTNWTSPTNILADDANSATYSSTTRDELNVTNCGFTIPTGSTITGIQVRVIGCATGGTTAARRFSMNLLNLGTCTEITTINQAQCATMTDQTLPASPDTWSCSAVSVNALNASAFGVAIRDNDTTAVGVLTEQFAEIIVTYTPPTTTTGATTTSTSTSTSAGGTTTTGTTLASSRNRLVM